MQQGIIILGHGSKCKEADLVFQDIVKQVRSRVINKKVKGAVIKFSQPKLAQVVEELVTVGVKQIVVIPLFLLPGLYTGEYIPNLIAELGKEYPNIEFSLGEPIGVDKKLSEIIINQIKNIS